MEHHEQAALFTWAGWQTAVYPELHLLYAIPNGGHRHKAVAARLSAEGVRRGVPDICLPVPRGAYHGLYLEMKWGKNRPTPEQKIWLEALAGQGYKTAVCHSFIEAQQTITQYLEQQS